MTRVNALAVVVAGLAAAHLPPVGAQEVEVIRVVATLSVYGSLASEIGGDALEIRSIADPNEDAHFVRPKPSFARDLRRADLFITTGLDLELWVPTLLDKAGNPAVSDGGRGYVTAHTGIRLLDIPASADRSAGDVHIYGNPHLHTDPLRVLQIARNITVGLRRVAPRRADEFDEALASFQDRIHRRLFGDALVDLVGGELLEELGNSGALFSFLAGNELDGVPLTDRLGGWLKRAEPLRGARIICYHKNWAYFEDRFGVSCADYVESKPGIPPTPRHVAELIELMRDRGIRVLLAANYFDRTKIETVARRGGAVPVVVPLYPSARPEIPDYFALMDLWIDSLLAAYQESR